MIDRKFVEFVAIMWGVGSSLILFVLWLYTWANGGEVCFSIIAFGEAWLEWFVWSTILALQTVGIYSWWDRS